MVVVAVVAVLIESMMSWARRRRLEDASQPSCPYMVVSRQHWQQLTLGKNYRRNEENQVSPRLKKVEISFASDNTFDNTI